MSKKARIDRCKLLFDQFLSVVPRELEEMAPGFGDFDGPNLEECKKNMRFLIEMWEGISANDVWDDLSWHAWTSIEAQLQNVINFYNQVKSTREQGQFQNFSIHLDSLVYHMRMFGLPFISLGGHNLEKTSELLGQELKRAIAARAETEILQKEVKALITPAVAGSLSQAFTARKDVLLYGRIVWGVVALLVGGSCIYATYDFASAVSDALIKGSVAGNKNDFVWLSVLIRSAILLPLYASFGFSFAQYKKERDFEEEYAHKAAVATSLPNYGDLTREPAVRDQIVTGATNVIFSSPTTKHAESEKQDKALGGVKEILDSVAKLIPKKE